MTVASNVKTCLASLKSAQASFSTLALNALDEGAKQTFHECMLEIEQTISDLQIRVATLENEEPQYKGF
ncbi:DUF1657 domain-containing protein [Microbacteriaceae bacterium 4G12]